MTVSSKFDAHVYVGSDYHSRFTPVPNRGIDDYLERMPKSGITRALLTPGGQLGEVEENYRTVCELVRQRPSTLFGLRRLNPRDPAVSHHIASAINTDGMSGFMLHPSWDTFVANSRIVYPVMEAIAALGVPVLVYSGDVPYSMPAQVADLAAAFPTVPAIMGHMGKTELYQHAADCAARVPNLYLETSGCNITNIIENAVKHRVRARGVRNGLAKHEPAGGGRQARDTATKRRSACRYLRGQSRPPHRQERRTTGEHDS